MLKNKIVFTLLLSLFCFYLNNIHAAETIIATVTAAAAKVAATTKVVAEETAKAVAVDIATDPIKESLSHPADNGTDKFLKGMAVNKAFSYAMSNPNDLKNVKNFSDLINHLKHFPEVKNNLQCQMQQILNSFTQSMHPNTTQDMIEACIIKDLKLQNINPAFIHNLQDQLAQKAFFDQNGKFIGIPASTLAKLNAQIIELQENLAKIVYDSEGFYKGFSSELDKQEWTNLIAKFAEHNVFTEKKELEVFLKEKEISKKSYFLFGQCNKNPVTIEKIKSVRFEQDFIKLNRALHNKDYKNAKSIVDTYKNDSSLITCEHYNKLHQAYIKSGADLIATPPIVKMEFLMPVDKTTEAASTSSTSHPSTAPGVTFRIPFGNARSDLTERPAAAMPHAVVNTAPAAAGSVKSNNSASTSGVSSSKSSVQNQADAKKGCSRYGKNEGTTGNANTQKKLNVSSELTKKELTFAELQEQVAQAAKKSPIYTIDKDGNQIRVQDKKVDGIRGNNSTTGKPTVSADTDGALLTKAEEAELLNDYRNKGTVSGEPAHINDSRHNPYGGTQSGQTVGEHRNTSTPAQQDALVEVFNQKARAWYSKLSVDEKLKLIEGKGTRESAHYALSRMEKHDPALAQQYKQLKKGLVYEFASALHPDASIEQLEKCILKIHRLVAKDDKLHFEQAVAHNAQELKAENAHDIELLFKDIKEFQLKVSQYIMSPDGYTKEALSLTDRKDLARFITNFAEKHAFENRAELEIFLRACHEYDVDAFEPIAKAKVGKVTNPIDKKREGRPWTAAKAGASHIRYGYLRAKSWLFGSTATKEQVLTQRNAQQFDKDYTACEHAMEKGNLAYIKNIVDQYNAQADSSVQMQEYTDMMNELMQKAEEQIAQQAGPSTASDSTRKVDEIILSDQTPSAAQTNEVATDLGIIPAEQYQLFKESSSACLEASKLYQELGLIKEAISVFEIAQNVEDFLQSEGIEYTKQNMVDIINKLETVTTEMIAAAKNEQAFKTGVVKGAVAGVTDIKGIFNNICNSFKGMRDLAYYMAQQDALNDAFDTGDFEHVRAGLQENQERAERLTQQFEQLSQDVQTFIDNMPNMTEQDWEAFGHQVGEFAGRETATIYAHGALAKGLTKAGRVLSNELKNTVQKGTIYVNLQNPTPTEVAARMAIKTEQQIAGRAGRVLGDAEISGLYADVGKAAVVVEDAVIKTAEKTGTLFKTADSASKSTGATRALQGAGIAGEAAQQAGPSTIDKGKYPANEPTAAVEDQSKFKGATQEPAQRTGKVEYKAATHCQEAVKNLKTEIRKQIICDKEPFKQSLYSTETYQQSLIQPVNHQLQKLGLQPPSKKFFKHIYNEHMPKGPNAILGKKSIFLRDTNLIEIATKAWENGVLVEPGVKVYDFNKIIGVTKDGIYTTKVKVVLADSQDRFRTIYPTCL
ncbi:MAG: hypothetical protein WD055_01920 [Candidatus Dependentiae bacterium]